MKKVYTNNLKMSLLKHPQKIKLDMEEKKLFFSRPVNDAYKIVTGQTDTTNIVIVISVIIKSQLKILQIRSNLSLQSKKRVID